MDGWVGRRDGCVRSSVSSFIECLIDLSSSFSVLPRHVQKKRNRLRGADARLRRASRAGPLRAKRLRKPRPLHAPQHHGPLGLGGPRDAATHDDPDAYRASQIQSESFFIGCSIYQRRITNNQAKIEEPHLFSACEICVSNSLDSIE